MKKLKNIFKYIIVINIVKAGGFWIDIRIFWFYGLSIGIFNNFIEKDKK